MPICPVCRNESPSSVCPGCGFDRSCDYESYPTLAMIRANTAAISRYKRRKNEISADSFRCMQCGGDTFRFRLREKLFACSECGAVLDARHFQTAADNQLQHLERHTACGLPKSPFAAYGNHVMVLHRDGTVSTAGRIPFALAQPIQKWTGITAIATSHTQAVGLRSDGTVVSCGYSSTESQIIGSWNNIVAVSISAGHTVGLRSDGTVVTEGRNDHGQCNVQHWDDIRDVAAGDGFTVGLRSDGSVITVGRIPIGRSDVSHWQNIVAIAVTESNIVGLRSDGTVVTNDRSSSRLKELETWNHITAIACSGSDIVGLRTDGTVTATGIKKRILENWRDIAAIATSRSATYALRTDGKILAILDEDYGQCNIAQLPQYRKYAVRSVAACDMHTAVLFDNGTVAIAGQCPFAAFNTRDWTDIAAIATSWCTVVGLRHDGTVVATGDNRSGACNTQGWTNMAAIAADISATVGIRKDGTVAIAGECTDHVRNTVSTWTDIVSVCIFMYDMIGLKKDGTIVTTGYHAAAVSNWTDIAAIRSNGVDLFGLRRDGSVVATGNHAASAGKLRNIASLSSDGRYGVRQDGTFTTAYDYPAAYAWKNLTAVANGRSHIVGLQSDGHVLTAFQNDYGQCSINETYL